MAEIKEKKPKYVKYRRRLPFMARVMIVFGLALLLFLIVVMILYVSGIRYITVTRTNGDKLKYFGIVDKTGRPTSGTISYADGRKAYVRKNTGLIEYTDGSVYEGALNSVYEREGQGKLLLSNGEEYEGNFSADVISGSGTYKFINGDVYTGTFADNKFDGYGKYTYATGEVYEGQFKNGLRDGEGTDTDPD